MWSPAENVLIGQQVDERSLTAKFTVGQEMRFKDPDYGAGVFVYMKGVASCVPKDWVTLNMDDGTVTRLAANAIGPVAVAMASITASYYGWFQRVGKALGRCLTLFADNGRVYITGTTGAVDDTSVAGDVVWNAKGASLTTVDSGYAEFEIDRPFVADRVSIIS